jgi:hypothetical protein
MFCRLKQLDSANGIPPAFRQMNGRNQILAKIRSFVPLRTYLNATKQK